MWAAETLSPICSKFGVTWITLICTFHRHSIEVYILGNLEAKSKPLTHCVQTLFEASFFPIAGHITLQKEATAIREYCFHEGPYLIFTNLQNSGICQSNRHSRGGPRFALPQPHVKQAVYFDIQYVCQEHHSHILQFYIFSVG